MVDVEIKHECDNCNNELSKKCFCNECKDAAADESFNEGKKQGRQEGYEEGYEAAEKELKPKE